MNQSLDRQYKDPVQAKPVSMGDGYDVKIKASEQQGLSGQPVIVRSSRGTRVVWHCSEYDF